MSNMHLKIIRRSGLSTTDEVVLGGTVDIDAALDWVNELHAAASEVDVFTEDASSVDIHSNTLLYPAGHRFAKFAFDDRQSFLRWEYQFTGDQQELDRLVDRATAVQLRQEMGPEESESQEES